MHQFGMICILLACQLGYHAASRHQQGALLSDPSLAVASDTHARGNLQHVLYVGIERDTQALSVRYSIASADSSELDLCESGIFSSQHYIFRTN